jgi:poly(A) polymerase
MAFKDAPNMKLSTFKKFISRPHFDTDLELHRIDCVCSHKQTDIYRFIVEKRAALPHEEIKPERLVKGDDLIAMGMAPGSSMGKLLGALMDEQLEGKFASRQKALERAQELLKG